MSPRRTALLGFGHVAEHGHLPAWLERRDFSIVAVAEPNAARRAVAERLLPGARIYADAAAALASEQLEVVDIAAPPSLHAPLVEIAARAGCHVLCEKPLTTTLRDAGALVEAVRRAGVTLFTVHNWKHSEQYAQLAAIAADGAIGAPLHLRFETIRNGRAMSVGGEWRGDAALAGGGILVDHGWHTFYLLLGIARQAPRRIRTTCERRRYIDAEVEDTVTCDIEFPSCRGEVFLTWAGDRRETRWRLKGTQGAVALIDDRGELTRTDTHRALTFSRSLSAGSHHPDWFGAVIEEFVAEIEDPARRGRNLEDALWCAALLGSAYQSAARGGEWVELSPQRAQRVTEGPCA